MCHVEKRQVEKNRSLCRYQATPLKLFFHYLEESKSFVVEYIFWNLGCNCSSFRNMHVTSITSIFLLACWRMLTVLARAEGFATAQHGLAIQLWSNVWVAGEVGGNCLIVPILLVSRGCLFYVHYTFCTKSKLVSKGHWVTKLYAQWSL